MIEREGSVIGDSATFAAADGRPEFAAAFDAQSGIPASTGFLDFDEEGLLVIGWSEPGFPDLRISMDTSGSVVAGGKCRCGGRGGTVTRTCTDWDCDEYGTECRQSGAATTGYCEWKAVAMQSVLRNGEPVISISGE